MDNELDRTFGDEVEAKTKTSDENSMVRSQAKAEQAHRFLIESLEKSQLMEYMMRTVFDTREEFLVFIDYVSWCDDFGLTRETARRYVAGKPAISGLGRKQLVEVLTLDWIADKHKGKQDGEKPRKLPE